MEDYLGDSQSPRVQGALNNIQYLLTQIIMYLSVYIIDACNIVMGLGYNIQNPAIIALSYFNPSDLTGFAYFSYVEYTVFIYTGVLAISSVLKLCALFTGNLYGGMS